MQGKNLVLGVSGGIAAYKSIELLRILRRQEAQVRVVMTNSALWFTGANTFQVLSGQPVCTSLFDEGDDASIRHIDWAENADAVVIAPATANIVGKLANGIADDALTTFVLACTCPILVCPSMNTNMYENHIVQENLKHLGQIGYHVLEPDSGELACGTTGPGRMPDPETIFEHLAHIMASDDFQGKRVLVTAGPTQEPIDPVRFISNPSSGKMGYAVARAAACRGARVTLISGPSQLPDPLHVETVRVQTAAEMADEVFSRFDSCDIVVKAAAVSDYRPEVREEQKIKKGSKDIQMAMVRTTDILKELGRRKKSQILVGFAAETEDLRNNAEKKLDDKNLDLIVGNVVGGSDAGFQTDENTVTIFNRSGKEESIQSLPKERIAHLLLDRILEIQS
jgi:phosphopantothenoylcysteine decarboxylase/phosphopantothenate--cysteine ligase